MPAPSPQVTAALATLQARWGAAAPRAIGDRDETPTIGALAAVPLPRRDEEEQLPSAPAPLPFDDRPPDRLADADDGRIVPTGFAALDAILGPGGVPRLASVAMHGDASSGKTTLALRLAAEAQAGGAIVAYLDLARAFDPVEAVARGVRLEWLVVLTPDTLDEGLRIAGALLQGRAVDHPAGRGHRASRIGSGVLPHSPVGRAACSSSWSRRACPRASPARWGNRSACAWSLPVGRGSVSGGTSWASRRR